MAYVDSLDLNSPIIEQLDEIYWSPFDTMPLHQFDLGLWHLSFNGKLLQQTYGGRKYAPYVTPIDKEESYPRFYGGQPMWDDESPYIWFTFHPIRTTCSVHVGPDDTWIVGGGYFSIQVIQVQEASKSGVFKLSDCSQLKQFIFKKHKDDLEYLQELGHEDRFSAWTPDEIQEYKIKGRDWYEIVDGTRALNWCFNLYTHLSDKHLLCITYEPRQFWPPYHVPSEKALLVSKSPMWDFMDNLELSKMEEGSQVITGTLEREADISGEDEFDSSW
ncbi:hypothetical protein ACJJI4_08710 [Microbulbifer sp. TRSA002]|uniref:hypothetical protein n=1 Tax=Microbulbifer sp. TRSA002 TaxID=3243382 RepID=UPI00403972AF